jgi:hypothetical protein
MNIIKILNLVLEKMQELFYQPHGGGLMIYFKGVSEMEILVLYLVILEVVSLGH